MTDAAANTTTPIRVPPEELVQGDLLLRRWQQSDAQALHAAVENSITELSPWMHWAAKGHHTLQDAERFLDFTNKSWTSGHQYDYAIIIDGRPKGSFGLMQPQSEKPAEPAQTLELGYWLATEVTGRGWASRAASLLTRIAFDIGAEHLQIRHGELNARSAAVPRRLGFSLLGTVACSSDTGDDGKGGNVVLWQMDKP